MPYARFASVEAIKPLTYVSCRGETIDPMFSYCARQGVGGPARAQNLVGALLLSELGLVHGEAFTLDGFGYEDVSICLKEKGDAQRVADAINTRWPIANPTEDWPKTAGVVVEDPGHIECNADCYFEDYAFQHGEPMPVTGGNFLDVLHAAVDHEEAGMKTARACLRKFVEGDPALKRCFEWLLK